ncbi:hypothetical protein D3C73_1612410 [compost metagenome]
MLIGRRWSDPVYMLAVIWAIIAIGVANRGETLLAWTCWGAAIVLLALSYVFNRQSAKAY